MIYSREELKIFVQSLLCFSEKLNRIDVKKNIDPYLKEQILISTNGCRDERFSERIFWILNDIYEYPTCVECGKQFRPRYYGLSTKSFNENKFCSVKCAKNNVEVEEKRRQTCNHKYGVDHHWKAESIKEQIKQTNKIIFGVEHPLQNKEVMDKIKKTNEERYGFGCSLQNENVQQKRVITWNKKYGVNHPLQNGEIKEQVRNTTKERFGVEYPLQSKEIMDKVKSTCELRYGVGNVMQDAEISEKNAKKKFKYMTLPSGKEIYYQRI